MHLSIDALAETSGKVLDSPKNKTAAQRSQDSERFISIDFNDVDINVFIKFISELTSKNFVVDQRVKGKVTIISPSRISIKEAYRVFESVLEVHGFTTVKAGEVTKIIPSPDARSKSIETRLKEEAASPEDRVVTQLISLKFASSSEIKKLFAPLVSKNSVILAYPPTNMLIVTDVYSNIKRLIRILNAIDVSGMGQELSIIPLEYADAAKFVKILDSVFQEKRKTKAPNLSTIKFVAD
ncbi:MAG: secretin N-terminal domain-containing protein, partial [Deltaproteobacteria bacterium]